MTTSDTVVAVITWDGSFREHFHTVDFFCNQTLQASQYEFVWVEYYSSLCSALREKIDGYPNAASLCLGREGPWHLGVCQNHGISSTGGDHLVLIDGDIAVDETFLEKDLAFHARHPDTAVYYRRWDEPGPPDNGAHRDGSIEYLEKNCRLTNPTNYGGCLTISRSLLDSVAGYEEHPLFVEAGAGNMELYIRLRNAGIPVLWHPHAKVYHPWHSGTIPPYDTEKHKKQEWLIRQRGLNIDTLADEKQVDAYLQSYEQQRGSGLKETSGPGALVKRLLSGLRHSPSR